LRHCAVAPNGIPGFVGTGAGVNEGGAVMRVGGGVGVAIGDIELAGTG